MRHYVLVQMPSIVFQLQHESCVWR